MTRITPPLSEYKLEDCGAYERFQVNEKQVYHRYNKDGDITWIPAFQSLNEVEQLLFDRYKRCTHTYKAENGLWHMGEAAMGKGMRPSVEEWYQNYLKSRVAASRPASEPLTDS
jgi:poly-gamma-glutamate capsule biosynthesis protein CapA/YwtB (metallophosphatase superfamily)